jgi:hypothetical protein
MKGKDSRIYKDETQVYVNVGKVGIRKNIELRWS